MDMAVDLGVDAFVNQSVALRDREDQQETLKYITVPTLVMCGAEDTLCPIERHQLMHGLIKGRDWRLLPEPGICQLWNKPITLIQRFYAGWRNNGSGSFCALLQQVDTPTVCNAIEVVEVSAGLTHLRAAPCRRPTRRHLPLSDMHAPPRFQHSARRMTLSMW